LISPIVGGGEELAGRLAGEALEVVGEVGLIEIAGGVGEVGEGVGLFGRIGIDDMAQADDRSEVFGGHADVFSESFFEGVLADIELFCEVADADGAFCLLDRRNSRVEEAVGGRSYFGAEELLDRLCPFGVGRRFRELCGDGWHVRIAF